MEKAFWEMVAMDKMGLRNKGLKMKSKLVSVLAFGLTLMPSISITAYDAKPCDPGKLKGCESARAENDEQGAPSYQDGQNGQDGQKGLLGLDGGHGGNGGNSEWGKGGDGGNGGDAD